METIPYLLKGPQKLAQVLAAAGDVIRITDVQQALQLDRDQATTRLSRCQTQGWRHRVGPGGYVPVSLDTLGAPPFADQRTGI